MPIEMNVNQNQLGQSLTGANSFNQRETKQTKRIFNSSPKQQLLIELRWAILLRGTRLGEGEVEAVALSGTLEGTAELRPRGRSLLHRHQQSVPNRDSQLQIEKQEEHEKGNGERAGNCGRCGGTCWWPMTLG